MSCTDNLVDLQYGSKVRGSNRHRLGINISTSLGRLLSVRARICHPLQHVSRSATALAKRLPGPHARPGELRDGAIESPDPCGDACVLYLEQKVAHLKWHGQIRWISQCVQHNIFSGISVEDCDQTEILVGRFESSSGPACAGPVDVSNLPTT